MTSARIHALAAVALATLVVALAPARADVRPRPALWLSLGAGAAEPVGDFADHSATQFLVDVSAVYFFRQADRVGLGLRYSDENYDQIHGRYDLPGIALDLTTHHALRSLTAGPLWRVGRGQAELWLEGRAGIAIAATETVVDQSFTYALATNHSDTRFAAATAASAAWRVHEGLPDVYLAAGVDALFAPGLRYVPAGGAQVNGNALELTTVKSDVVTLGWRAAVTLALRTPLRK